MRETTEAKSILSCVRVAVGTEGVLCEKVAIWLLLLLPPFLIAESVLCEREVAEAESVLYVA